MNEETVDAIETRNLAPIFVGEIEFSPALAQIAKALIRAQSSMDEIFKDSTNPHFRSKYAALPACLNAVKPALLANGIALLQPATSSEDASVVYVTTMFLHESGEWMRCKLGLRPVKDDPQGAGSAITYGRRYTLLGMCGVAPDDDDDGSAGSYPPRGSRARQQAVSEESPPADIPVSARATKDTPGTASEKTLGKLTGAFSQFGMASGEIGAYVSMHTNGRITSADDLRDLSTNEATKIGVALAENPCICGALILKGKAHERDDSGAPCLLDTSPEAMAWHANSSDRFPTEQEIPF